MDRSTDGTESAEHPPGTERTGTPENAEWLIDVTDADIHAARDAWRAAVAGKAPATRVAELHRGYERLVRTQGRQLGEAVRRRPRAA